MKPSITFGFQVQPEGVRLGVVTDKEVSDYYKQWLENEFWPKVDIILLFNWIYDQGDINIEVGPLEDAGDWDRLNKHQTVLMFNSGIVSWVVRRNSTKIFQNVYQSHRQVGHRSYWSSPYYMVHHSPVFHFISYHHRKRMSFQPFTNQMWITRNSQIKYHDEYSKWQISWYFNESKHSIVWCQTRDAKPTWYGVYKDLPRPL